MQNEIQAKLKELSEEIKKIDKEKNQGETATRQFLIEPFFVALGYDTRSAFGEYVLRPENVADNGSKEGKKVDYALLQNEKPLLLIEAKGCKVNLNDPKYYAQLEAYFSSRTKKFDSCRFAILTNGIEYRFYSDFINENLMDDTPFLVINIENLKESDYEKICLFAKGSLNLKNVREIKDKLKKYFCDSAYAFKVEDFLKKQVENPDNDFVKFIADKFIDKKLKLSKNEIHNYFREYVKKSFENIFAEKPQEIPHKTQEIKIQENTNLDFAEKKALEIAKRICANKIDNVNRLGTKIEKEHIAILLDKDNGKNRDNWICRFYLSKDEKKKDFPFTLIAFPLKFFPDIKRGANVSEYKVSIQTEYEIENWHDLFIKTLEGRFNNN